MEKRTYLLLLFWLLVFIGVVNFFAMEVHLYWDFPWFDMPMHFLGGLWSGSIGLWFFLLRLPEESRIEKTKQGPRRVHQSGIFSVLATGILSGLLIGVLWEVFELLLYLYQIMPVGGANNILDTLGDLFFDTVGAFVAGIFFLSLKMGNAIKLKETE
ncbi:MAG TPA: hypothetical protein VFM02_02285 [Candidatus Paceibacterota bacterium]|nr:hypothetical protein [Candidatus Paceibacterota bacterium]